MGRASIRQSGAKVDQVLLRVLAEGAVGGAKFQEARQRADAGAHDLRRHVVDFAVGLVADEDAFVGIEYQQADRQVVERACEPVALQPGAGKDRAETDSQQRAGGRHDDGEARRRNEIGRERARRIEPTPNAAMVARCWMKIPIASRNEDANRERSSGRWVASIRAPAANAIASTGETASIRRTSSPAPAYGSPASR